MNAAAWKAQAEAERRELRQRIEHACAELQWRAAHDPDGCPMLALQIGAMEQYSNALGYRIVQAELEAKKAGQGQ